MTPSVPPLPPFDVASGESRERALDALGAWFVEALIAADGDAAVSTDVMTRAVVAFFDIREAGDLPRGMYAGHFFLVDGVGIGASDRPVPWFALGERIGRARLDALLPLYDAAERRAR